MPTAIIIIMKFTKSQMPRVRKKRSVLNALRLSSGARNGKSVNSTSSMASKPQTDDARSTVSHPKRGAVSMAAIGPRASPKRPNHAAE